MSVSWRSLNRSLHRDLGYLAVGLTLLYAVTGILLNHLHDWKPNWRITRFAGRVSPMADPGLFTPALVPDLLAQLGEQERPTGVFQPDPGSVQLFFDGGRRLTVDLATGAVEGDVALRRPLVAGMNDLHLNRAGRAWTLLTDLYAAVLAFLAVSGLFILRGKAGLTGRGWKLAAAGLLLPLLLALLF